jgi:alpha-glutamyl/putrescinyl thymine pyrophosphorylase clade 1
MLSSHGRNHTAAMGRASELAYWIVERERIRKLHDSGMPRPWTANAILDEYRFCNVRREDDRVTRWLAKNWRLPYKDHPNLTVAMLLARMINWPPTLEAIGFPDKWEPERIVDHIHACQDLGKAWTSAYVITTCGKRMDKAVYVVQTVCQAVYSAGLHPLPGGSLQAFWTRLRGIDGLGAGFIAAQVVADLKNTPDNPLAKAEDWWTWAVPGPGSRRGLNRYFYHDHNTTISDHDWYKGLQVIIQETQPLVLAKVGRIHAQDWQNVLCEWDKYERVRNGEGRPRQRYSPTIAY